MSTKMKKWEDLEPLVTEMLSQGFALTRSFWDGAKACYRLTFLMGEVEMDKRRMDHEKLRDLVESLSEHFDRSDVQKREYGLRVRIVAYAAV